LGLLFGRGWLAGCETAGGLHLLADRLTARGGVLHHAVQSGVRRRDLRALIGTQAEGLAQRVERHPVIRRRLKPTLAHAGSAGGRRRILGERGTRQESDECGNSQRAHSEWLRREGHSLYAFGSADVRDRLSPNRVSVCYRFDTILGENKPECTMRTPSRSSSLRETVPPVARRGEDDQSYPV